MIARTSRNEIFFSLKSDDQEAELQECRFLGKKGGKGEQDSVIHEKIWDASICRPALFFSPEEASEKFLCDQNRGVSILALSFHYG